MRVLFDHPDPFALAHGGFQTQIEQTRLSLNEIGVQVDFLEWWNASQEGDIIHYFGRPRADYIKLAHSKGIKVVLGELLTSTGSRSPRELALQRFFTNISRRLLPATFTSRLAWDSYQIADACIALTQWEAHLMNYLFDAPKERIHVLPNGVEQAFLRAAPATRGQWLVCTATITERKRILELAEAAVTAKTPIWIIGKPYSATDSYAQRFLYVAKNNPSVVRYEGPIQDRVRLAQVYSEACGFVLLSAFETRSIAAEEAAACGCPLLLSDLPWAHSVFEETASYCPLGNATTTAPHLRAFYDSGPSLPKPLKPKSWTEVAQQLREIYTTICPNTSR